MHRAMCIDHETRKPVIGNKIGSLSGPAIKSMAVYMIWEVYRAVEIPIIGMGGVANYKDVIEFMAAGAVAFGTVNYVDPMALPCALAGLIEYLKQHSRVNCRSRNLFALRRKNWCYSAKQGELYRRWYGSLIHR